MAHIKLLIFITDRPILMVMEPGACEMNQMVSWPGFKVESCGLKVMALGLEARRQDLRLRKVVLTTYNAEE